MTGTFEISEGLLDEGAGEARRFEHRDGGAGIWGVWDWEARSWRRPPNYTQCEAASMSVFLNKQDKPGGLARV